MNKFFLTKSSYICKGKHLIAKICLSENCSHYIYCCGYDQCQFCTALHLNCNFAALQQIYTYLVQNQNKHLQYFKEVMMMQEKMIGLIKQSSTKSKRQLPTAGISTLSKSLLYRLFIEGDLKSTQKRQIRQLFQQFKSNNVYLQRQNQKIKKRNDNLAKESIQLLKRMLKVKQNYIQNIVRIQSTIIQDYHHIEYIYQLLTFSAKELQLIFRASQHAFSAKQFHQKCDQVSNTLTVIKTSFGNVIAAFAIPKWFSGKSNYASDHSKVSFIASVTERQKMILKQQKFAIFCDEKHGPCFGRGFDLKITDKCNENENSYLFAPYSYILDKGGQVDHKALWKGFIGSSDGYKFKVSEYEVFKVIS